MVVLSSITACIPWLPTNAEAALALRSPRSLLLAVQPDKLPDSNPSTKITSDTLDVFVAVGVFEAVGVLDGVNVRVGVNVAVAVSVIVGVKVCVGEGPTVGVFVGVKVGVGV